MRKGTAMHDKNELRCSFCNKSEHEVQKLVAGPKVYICNECVKIATAIIEHEHRQKPRLFTRVLQRLVGLFRRVAPSA